MVLRVVLGRDQDDVRVGQGAQDNNEYIFFLHFLSRKHLKVKPSEVTSSCYQRRVMEHNIHSGGGERTGKKQVCQRQNNSNTFFQRIAVPFAKQNYSSRTLGSNSRKVSNPLVRSCVFILNRTVLVRIQSRKVVYRMPAEAGIPPNLAANWGYFSWTSSCVRVASA
jgi:hypothetical protein